MANSKEITVDAVKSRRGKVIVHLSTSEFKAVFVGKADRNCKKISVRIVEKIRKKGEDNFVPLYIPKEIFKKMKRISYAITRDYKERERREREERKKREEKLFFSPEPLMF